MTADQTYRPNVTELCQMMVDIIMNQLDYMRETDHFKTAEIKQLKERLKYFEGPTSTGFKGFSTTEAANMGATTKSANAKFSPFMPTPNNKFSTQMQIQNKAIAAAVEDASAEQEQDPVVLYLETMHKLNFLCH